MRWLMGLALVGLVVAHAMAADEKLAPGLVARMYAMGDLLEDFPAITFDKRPTVQRIDSMINVEVGAGNWPGTSLSDHFYIRWTGVIRIPKDGKYKFYTESDDGSRLSIDGKDVVDNGGLHAMAEKEGEIELKAGIYPIVIQYFENEGDAACKISWEPPGSGKEIIPAKVLFHRPTDG